MKKVYVVVQHSGEDVRAYEEFEDTPVMVCQSKEKAESYIEETLLDDCASLEANGKKPEWRWNKTAILFNEYELLYYYIEEVDFIED